MIGQITVALQGFMHPSFNRTHAWDLKQFDSVLPFIDAVPDLDIQDIIRSTHSQFQTQVLPASISFRWSCIQGDCNDANIIIDEYTNQIIGLIDFGDTTYTWTVNDIATAMCYALLTSFGKQHPHHVLKALFTSYNNEFPLLPCEIAHLKTLITMRLSLSTAIGAYSILQNPHDEYLKLHAIPARNALRFMWRLPKDYFSIGHFTSSDGTHE
jgi:Ser/Thr protein kinase RdoA (MazF antagonist)